MNDRRNVGVDIGIVARDVEVNVAANVWESIARNVGASAWVKVVDDTNAAVQEEINER